MTEESLLDQQPKNYLGELVGEDKKFKDVEALARGKYESDSYIKVLEKRVDDIREDYLKMREESMSRAKLEDLIDQLESRSSAASSTTQAPIARETQPTFKPEDIENLVDRRMTEKENAKQRQSNLGTVRAKIKERFGTNADALREHLDNLGLSEEVMIDLAGKSPAAALNALGLNQTNRETFQAPPNSSRNFKPVTDKKRTWSYYQELKKNDLKTYLSPKIAVQMLEDAEALGSEFEDGDFHSRNTP